MTGGPTPIGEMLDEPPDGGLSGATHYKVHGPSSVEFCGHGLWSYYNPIAFKIEAARFDLRISKALREQMNTEWVDMVTGARTDIQQEKSA